MMDQGEALELEQFMDVVWLYKCKFCDFQSSTHHAISSHVIQEHVAIKTVPQEEDGVPAQVTSNVQTDDAVQGGLEEGEVSVESLVENNETQTAAIGSLETAQSERKAQVIQSETIQSETIQSEMIQSGTIQSEMIQSETSQSETIQSEAIQSEAIQSETIQSEANQSETIQLETNQSESIQSEVIQSETIQSETIQPPDNEQPAEKCTPVEVNDEGQQTEMSPATEDPSSSETYQELFVCGQCSVGFTSMEECQAHLATEHNVRESVCADSQVSIGTQASLPAKLGRKTKAQKIKEAEEKAEQAEQPQNLACTDLSLITRRMNGAEGKRTVRPPKRLMQDYRIQSRLRKPPSRPSARHMCPRKKCKAKFRSKEGLELHKKCHLEEGAYKCLECEQLHPHWKPMQWHLWLAHGVDVDLCKCHLCHYRAENWQKIDAHLESHEMEEEEEGGQAEDSEEHEVCPVVNKKPKRTHTDRQKRVRKSPGDGKPPECDICGRSFSTAAALKGHVELVHKKERPFSCTFCEYTTGRKAALDLHLRTHTGEKPFKCDMCNYRASDHNSLRRHRMRHTGDRSYRCQLCPYTCIQSISLKMHMKNKHPGSQAMYACDLCPFHAVNKTSIDHHMEDHRRGLVEELKAPTRASDKKPTHLVLPVNQISSNVISLAAKEAELIEGEETSEQISGPSASYTIEANDDCMNMISSNDVVFTIESSSDGKQYLVPSTLSAVGLTVSGQQAVQPHAEASDRDEVQMVLVEGQHQVTPDALQHLVTDVTGATTLQDI